VKLRRNKPALTPEAPSAPLAGPLDGIRVLEATQMVSGPLGAMLLADMGADVIKLEQPDGGDRMRYLGHRKGAISAVWANSNRGKRTMAIDLTHTAAQRVVHELAITSDVFIQNFRPGVADRLGIGEAALRARNPELIYVSISGFGDSGPYADQKVYDYVVQALSGMASLQGGSGEPTLLRNIVIDKVTAYTVANAVLAALVARSAGAGGQHITINMLDTALAFLWPDGMMQHTFLGEGITPGPAMADGYDVYPTADGHIAALPTSERQFSALCRALSKPEWLEDERYATLAARNIRVDEVRALIGAEMRKYSSADVLALMHAQDVPGAAVNHVHNVHLDPQVKHNGSLIERDHPYVGLMREPRPAAVFSETPTALGRHAPKLDEHTDEILRELGIDDATIAELREADAFGSKRPPR
jgi:crotonobetainyl-CoA:carnitine CoA-transferase CaiB-like acyl-CoA transferase